MYKLDPIYDRAKMVFDLPSSMYSLKSVYEPLTTSVHTDAEAALNPPPPQDKRLFEVVRRQNSLLAKINALEMQLQNVLTISETATGSSSDPSRQVATGDSLLTASPTSSTAGRTLDFALHCSVENIPHAVFPLLNQLQTLGARVLIRIHWKSSFIRGSHQRPPLPEWLNILCDKSRLTEAQNLNRTQFDLIVAFMIGPVESSKTESRLVGCSPRDIVFGEANIAGRLAQEAVVIRPALKRFYPTSEIENIHRAQEELSSILSASNVANLASTLNPDQVLEDLITRGTSGLGLTDSLVWSRMFARYLSVN